MNYATAPIIASWLAVAAAGLTAMGCGPPAEPLPSQPPSAKAAATPDRRQGSRDEAKDEAEDKTKDEAGIDAADYLPLSARSSWEYDVTIDLPLGVSRQASAVTEVAGLVEIDGKTYYKVVMQVFGAPVEVKHVAFYRPSERGVFQMLEGEEEHGEWLYLPPRLKVGQKWSAETGKSTFHFEVVDRRDLDCLGKTYQDCLQIAIEMKSKFGSIKQEQWLAPGVGPVKQIDHHALFDSTSLLKKYVADETSPKSSRPKSPQ